MPNNNAHVELSTEDLRMIGAAFRIASSVADGRTPDIELFEAAVSQIEQQESEVNVLLNKLVDAEIFAKTYGNGDVSYA